MNDKSYNGWSNYETWAVNLWLDNSEGDQELLREFAEQCIRDAELDGSDRDHAAYECSRMIREYVEESMPELDGMFSDLLQSALSEVNWLEIAGHIVDDMLVELEVTLSE
jgi:hypothetical protein